MVRATGGQRGKGGKALSWLVVVVVVVTTKIGCGNCRKMGGKCGGSVTNGGTHNALRCHCSSRVVGGCASLLIFGHIILGICHSLRL